AAFLARAHVWGAVGLEPRVDAAPGGDTGKQLVELLVLRQGVAGRGGPRGRAAHGKLRLDRAASDRHQADGMRDRARAQLLEQKVDVLPGADGVANAGLATRDRLPAVDG